ncbi:MAG: HAH_0734 family protein [Halococcoides sp.]
MKRLIVRGDPGIRRDAVIDLDGEEYVCFSVNRQGEWHGPDDMQLWCTIGTPDERDAFEQRAYIPMHIDTIAVEASDVTVSEAA